MTSLACYLCSFVPAERLPSEVPVCETCKRTFDQHDDKRDEPSEANLPAPKPQKAVNPIWAAYLAGQARTNGWRP